jgi:nucleotide-binding universal stress UspA family protein
MAIETILVPTDFSEPANHAVEQAAELAIRARAKLELFHVVEPTSEDSPGVVQALQDYLKHLEQDARKSLSLKVEVLRGNGVDVRFSTVLGVHPFEGIVAKVRETEPDLLVMGTHGRAGLGRLLMGSVTEKVLRHVSKNLLTLSPRSAIVRSGRAFERVLVPVDFSEFSKRAVRLASSLLLPGGELEVLHVVASPIHPSFYAGGITRLFQLDPEMPERIRKSLAEWLEAPAARIHVREGDVSAEILDAAGSSGAQLLVMGTRGLSGLDHFLMGSVTERVVRHARLPVLAVH